MRMLVVYCINLCYGYSNDIIHNKIIKFLALKLYDNEITLKLYCKTQQETMLQDIILIPFSPVALFLYSISYYFINQHVM